MGGSIHLPVEFDLYNEIHLHDKFGRRCSINTSQSTHILDWEHGQDGVVDTTSLRNDKKVNDESFIVASGRRVM